MSPPAVLSTTVTTTAMTTTMTGDTSRSGCVRRHDEEEVVRVLTELVVRLEHRPGTLAALSELLGANEVDIVALAVMAISGDEAVARMVVQPADAAVKVLGEAGARLERVHEVLVVTLDDEPGALGHYCRRLADAGINLEAVYVAGDDDGSKQLVMAVSDLEAARRIPL
jgi:hypothetical protein